MTATSQPDNVVRAGDALVVTDVQRDFLPGGALAVAGGDRVLAAMNGYLALFAARGLPVFATRDWHPAGHCSFAAQGGPWPVHCVAGSPGAEFARGLQLPPDAVLISKATEAAREAYSAFEGTDLDARLRQAGITRLWIGGLATDYCVLQTARDACALGYTVVVLGDAIAAVDARAGDGERAIAQMRAAGVRLAARPDLR